MSDIYITFYATNSGAKAAVVAPTLVTGTCLVVVYSSSEIRSPTLVTGTVILTAVLQGAVTAVSIVTGEFSREITKTNWVAWSKIGEAKIELDRMNDSGAKPMSWPSIVYQILCLGEFYIIYGSKGITKMYPVSLPAATFGFQDLADFGIKARGAVAGCREVHFFISSEGSLYKVQTIATNNTPQLQKLGYEEFLSSLGVNTRMFYNSELQKLYISDGSLGYTLTGEGLGGGYPTLTFVETYPNGTYFGRSSAATETVELQTGIIDFGLREVKTLKELTLIADSPNYYSFAVEYRFAVSLPWSQTPWTAFNSYGEGFPWVSGQEFRVKIKAETLPSLVAIQDLSVTYQLRDSSLKGAER